MTLFDPSLDFRGEAYASQWIDTSLRHSLTTQTTNECFVAGPLVEWLLHGRALLNDSLGEGFGPGSLWRGGGSSSVDKK